MTSPGPDRPAPAIALVVHGIGGRMGRRVADLAAAGDGGGFRLVAGLERSGHPLVGGRVAGAPVFDLFNEAAALIPAPAAGAGVVVDFSAPQALADLAGFCAERRLALVSGTTGLSDAAETALDAAARHVAVVWAPNMSLGVNLLYRLVGLTARVLGGGADVEIVETHHRHKADAPSGTARKLAEKVQEARPGSSLKLGRSGLTPGGRPAGEIGVHALRLGEVVGDHAVHFGLDHEIITLAHHAQGREAFAAGALAAARFAALAEPGLYGMEDVLGLSRTAPD